MEFFKDQYSIEEVSRLLSEEDPDRKKLISAHLEADYTAEISQALEELRSRKGHECDGWEQALCVPLLSRDEVLRYAGDILTRKTPESKPKRRGRPEGRAQVERDIQTALNLYKGKNYSNSHLRNLIAEKLKMSSKTLERHYKHCFPDRKIGKK